MSAFHHSEKGGGYCFICLGDCHLNYVEENKPAQSDKRKLQKNHKPQHKSPNVAENSKSDKRIKCYHLTRYEFNQGWKCIKCEPPEDETPQLDKRIKCHLDYEVKKSKTVKGLVDFIPRFIETDKSDKTKESGEWIDNILELTDRLLKKDIEPLYFIEQIIALHKSELTSNTRQVVEEIKKALPTHKGKMLSRTEVKKILDNL